GIIEDEEGVDAAKRRLLIEALFWHTPHPETKELRAAGVQGNCQWDKPSQAREGIQTERRRLGGPPQAGARASIEREGRICDRPADERRPPARFAGPPIAKDCRGVRDRWRRRAELRAAVAEAPGAAAAATSRA